MPSAIDTEKPLDLPTSGDQRLWVASSERLVEGGYLRMDIGYAGEAISVVVFRYQGECLAYRNLCVHMPRRLDCEKDMIFDASGRYLRCSMHGIVYDPNTGAALSEICTGKRLTPITVREDGEGVWIDDRLAKPLTGAV
jgi:nitrite reductase/ring-hydroxylating ferredoxin subunit